MSLSVLQAEISIVFYKVKYVTSLYMAMPERVLWSFGQN